MNDTGEHLSTLSNNPFTIFAGAQQFCFPLFACYEKRIYHLATHRKARLEQQVSDLSNGLLRAPTIQLLSAPVPEEDGA